VSPPARHPGDRAQTSAERRAAGRVQLGMWVPAEVGEALAWLAERWGTTKAEAVARALSEAEKREKRKP
jgi:hypothetical protein